MLRNVELMLCTLGLASGAELVEKDLGVPVGENRIYDG